MLQDLTRLIELKLNGQYEICFMPGRFQKSEQFETEVYDDGRIKFLKIFRLNDVLCAGMFALFPVHKHVFTSTWNEYCAEETLEQYDSFSLFKYEAEVLLNSL